MILGYRLLRCLPPSAVSTIGARLHPWLFTHPSPDKRQERLIAFSKRVYPRLTVAQRTAWAEGHLRAMGRVRAEIALPARYLDSADLQVEGMAHVDAARSTGRPLIIPFVHLGNWKITVAALMARGVPGVQIALPEADLRSARIVTDFRRRFGIETLAPGYRGAAGALRALRAGQALFLAIDELHRARVNAPRLGRTGVGADGNLSIAARLSLATNALIVPAFTLRRHGVRLVLHVLAPIDPQTLCPADPPKSTPTEDDLVRAIVAHLDGLITPIVLAHLDQWAGLAPLIDDREMRRATGPLADIEPGGWP